MLVTSPPFGGAPEKLLADETRSVSSARCFSARLISRAKNCAYKWRIPTGGTVES